MRAKPCGDLRSHAVLEALDKSFLAALHFGVFLTVCEEVGMTFLPVGGSSSMWESHLTAMLG